MQYTGVPNMAETIPLSPDQVNACVGSVNGSSKRGSRNTHTSLRVPMLLSFVALACVQTPVNAWEAEQGCEKFEDIYKDGEELCNTIFDDSFVYSADEDKAYTMWWFGGENPNNKVSENLGLPLPDTCELQYSDYSHPKPTKESNSFTECVPWKDEACCKQSTVSSSEHLRTVYGEGYEWDRCGPMSPECARFFVQEACLYECDVHSGHYRKCSDAQVDAAADNEDDPCHENRWEIQKMPIKASYCNAWYQSCRNDYFCSGKSFFSCNAHYWEKDKERKQAVEKAAIARADALEADLEKSKLNEGETHVGLIIGLIAAVVVVCGGLLLYVIRREKAGKPIFTTLPVATDEVQI